jgi:hypothetical protein
MFEENNLSLETENVEQTTEQTIETEPVKMYTEEEFNTRMNELLPKKLERAKAKMRREFEEEYAGYKEAEAVLNAGLGTSNIGDATNELKEFYKQKGVDIPRYQPEVTYSDEEVGVLANHEAQKIIDAGFDEVIDEVNRLAEKGLDGMSTKEKRLFKQLADYRQREESRIELAQIGVGAEVLDDADFQAFEKKLNPNMSAKEKYEMYLQTKPKAHIEPIGSMRGIKTGEPAVKEFYTHEEAMKFTKADFDKNPALFKAVTNSMQKWR